jgi:hypothetical protein
MQKSQLLTLPGFGIHSQFENLRRQAAEPVRVKVAYDFDAADVRTHTQMWARRCEEWPESAPRPPFGLPEVPVAVRTSRLCVFQGSRKSAKHSPQFGCHREIAAEG